MTLEMVDLQAQYEKIRPEINQAIQEVLDTTTFINGAKVKEFASRLSAYTGARHTIPCANGTDALQIALMALALRRGDEVIVPSFTYAAAAEVVALLGLVPVMVDVERASFNLAIKHLRKALSPRTRAIIPVHLFGQACDMEPIMRFSTENDLYVIEDNAQSIGCLYTFPDGSRRQAGTIGHIGCTSFFPSKPLGCYGDGGALFTDDDGLAEKIRIITSHGQRVKYQHEIIGCNSRLDTIQAAILGVKLKYLDQYNERRYRAARYYTAALSGVAGIEVPVEHGYSTHLYHQYTLRVGEGKRNALKRFLAEDGIPSMIYYPLALQDQLAFKAIARLAGSLDTARELAGTVLSLPIFPDITTGQQDRVISRIKEFYQ